MAAESSIANSRYTYQHEDHTKGPLEAIDAHNVLLHNNTNSKLLLTFLSALLLTATAFSLSSLKQGESSNMLLWSLLLSATLVVFLRKPVEKESVIIMPAFGVQLETHYRRGRTIHRFIPIDKILKPVLSECVTPVTCYWSLSLIVREEEELVLVFKELAITLRLTPEFPIAACRRSLYLALYFTMCIGKAVPASAYSTYDLRPV
ncbi:hypothetical protein C3L33_17877, partial [Rhododendron williamsianum]